MKETILQGLNIGLIDHMSYEKISEILELIYGHAPARTNNFNPLFEKNEEEFFEKEEKELEESLKKAGYKTQWCLPL